MGFPENMVSPLAGPEQTVGPGKTCRGHIVHNIFLHAGPTHAFLMSLHSTQHGPLPGTFKRHARHRRSIDSGCCPGGTC